jgi:Icc-related predicted phosphoesterase
MLNSSRILVLGDLHANQAWLRWLVTESRNFSLVCITGDTLNLGCTSRNPKEHLATVLRYLRAIQAPLAIVSGNHDVCTSAGFDEGQWLSALRKRQVWVDGDVFCFSGYRIRCVPWCSPLPGDASDHMWLMHEPPYGARTSTVAGGVSFGSEEMRDLCRRGRGPRYTIGGHIHQPLGWGEHFHGTITLNAGQGDHPDIPSHIVMDLASGLISHRRATRAGIKESTWMPAKSSATGS